MSKKPIRIKVRRVDKTLPLPAYQTKGSAGFDFPARKTVKIKPKQLALIPLNIALELPKNCILILVARSSMPKKGLMLANGIGIGDPDFAGNNDEYIAIVYNYSDRPVTLKRGERIVQGVLVPFSQVKWKEVDDLGNFNRGGIGSTG